MHRKVISQPFVFKTVPISVWDVNIDQSGKIRGNFKYFYKLYIDRIQKGQTTNVILEELIESFLKDLQKELGTTISGIGIRNDSESSLFTHGYGRYTSQSAYTFNREHTVAVKFMFNDKADQARFEARKKNNAKYMTMIQLLSTYIDLIKINSNRRLSSYKDENTGAISREGLEHDLEYILNRTDRDAFLIFFDIPGIIAALNFLGHDVGDEGLKHFFKTFSPLRAGEHVYRDVTMAIAMINPKDKPIDDVKSNISEYIVSREKNWKKCPFIVPQIDLRHIAEIKAKDAILAYVNDLDRMTKMLANTIEYLDGNLSEDKKLPHFLENSNFRITHGDVVKEVSLLTLMSLLKSEEIAPIDVLFVDGLVANIDLNKDAPLFIPKRSIRGKISDFLKASVIHINNSDPENIKIDGTKVFVGARDIFRNNKFRYTNLDVGTDKYKAAEGDESVFDKLNEQLPENLSPDIIRLISSSLMQIEERIERGEDPLKVKNDIINYKVADFLRRFLNHVHVSFEPSIEKLSLVNKSSIAFSGKISMKGNGVMSLNEDRTWLLPVGDKHTNELYIKVELEEDHLKLAKQRIMEKLNREELDNMNNGHRSVSIKRVNRVYKDIINSFVSDLKHIADGVSELISNYDKLRDIQRSQDYDQMTGLFKGEKIKKVYISTVNDTKLNSDNPNSIDRVTTVFFDLVGFGSYASISDEVADDAKRQLGKILKTLQDEYNEVNTDKQISIGISNGEEFSIVGRNLSKNDMESFIAEFRRVVKEEFILEADIDSEHYQESMSKIVGQEDYDTYFNAFAIQDLRLDDGGQLKVDPRPEQKFRADVVSLLKPHFKSNKLIAKPGLTETELKSFYGPEAGKFISIMNSKFAGFGGVSLSKFEEEGSVTLDAATIMRAYDFFRNIPEQLSDEDRVRSVEESNEEPILWLEDLEDMP